MKLKCFLKKKNVYARIQIYCYLGRVYEGTVRDLICDEKELYKVIMNMKILDIDLAEQGINLLKIVIKCKPWKKKHLVKWMDICQKKREEENMKDFVYLVETLAERNMKI